MSAKRFIFLLIFPAVFFNVSLYESQAEGLDGNSYYTYIFDVNNNEFQHFTWTFTGSGSDEVSDNETDAGEDNETNVTQRGAVTIDVEDKTFDNATGTYFSRRYLFNGSWEGVVTTYSDYYQENIYTYYSYLFFGISLFNNSNNFGVVYSIVTTESTKKGTEKTSGFMPFYGLLVSTSEN